MKEYVDRYNLKLTRWTPFLKGTNSGKLMERERFFIPRNKKEVKLERGTPGNGARLEGSYLS